MKISKRLVLASRYTKHFYITESCHGWQATTKAATAVRTGIGADCITVMYNNEITVAHKSEVSMDDEITLEWKDGKWHSIGLTKNLGKTE